MMTTDDGDDGLGDDGDDHDDHDGGDEDGVAMAVTMTLVIMIGSLWM